MNFFATNNKYTNNKLTNILHETAVSMKLADYLLFCSNDVTLHSVNQQKLITKVFKYL